MKNTDSIAGLIIMIFCFLTIIYLIIKEYRREKKKKLHISYRPPDPEDDEYLGIFMN